MDPTEPPDTEPGRMQRLAALWDEGVTKKAEEIGCPDNRQLAAYVLTLESKIKWLEERVGTLHSEVKALKGK